MRLAGTERTTFVEHAYWIAMGRAPSPEELARAVDGLHEGTKLTLVINLVTQPEAVRYRAAWDSGQHVRDPGEIERGLRSLGSHETFIASAYECLLGRAVDDDALQHYTAALASGDQRFDTLHNIVRSDEFQRRVAELLTFGTVPRDVQLCELANPAKWDNPEWVDILRSLGPHRRQGVDAPESVRVHSVRVRVPAVRRADGGCAVVSVGAGHELVLYWLANHVGAVVATDIYGGAWKDARGHERRSRGDGGSGPCTRHLHIAGIDCVSSTWTAERSRFPTRRSISPTACRRSSTSADSTARRPRCARWAAWSGRAGLSRSRPNTCSAVRRTTKRFSPTSWRRSFANQASSSWSRSTTACTAATTTASVDLHTRPYQSPHMVVRFGDTVFTTVMVFLRKTS